MFTHQWFSTMEASVLLQFVPWLMKGLCILCFEKEQIAHERFFCSSSILRRNWCWDGERIGTSIDESSSSCLTMLPFTSPMRSRASSTTEAFKLWPYLNTHPNSIHLRKHSASSRLDWLEVTWLIGKSKCVNCRDFPWLVVQFFAESDDWTLHSLVSKEISRNFGVEFWPERLEREQIWGEGGGDKMPP